VKQTIKQTVDEGISQDSFELPCHDWPSVTLCY